MSPRKSAGKELSRDMVLNEARNLFASVRVFECLNEAIG